MEEFLPAVLVFIAIVASVVKNMKKVNEQTPQQQAPSDFPTWKEVFTTFESMETPKEEPVFTPATEPRMEADRSETREMAFLEEVRKRRESKPARHMQSTISTPEVDNFPAEKEVQKKHKQITLNTKSEAKRAFIYSEILTRKY